MHSCFVFDNDKTGFYIVKAGSLADVNISGQKYLTYYLTSKNLYS